MLPPCFGDFRSLSLRDRLNSYQRLRKSLVQDRSYFSAGSSAVQCAAATTEVSPFDWLNKHETTRNNDQPTHRCHHSRTGAAHRPSGRRGRTAGRRQHDPFHRPLPQGSHRRAGRGATAPDRDPTGLPAQPFRTQAGCAGINRRTGETDARTAVSHRSRRHLAEGRGSLSALPSQATHAGDHCPGARAGAAG